MRGLVRLLLMPALFRGVVRQLGLLVVRAPHSMPRTVRGAVQPANTLNKRADSVTAGQAFCSGDLHQVRLCVEDGIGGFRQNLEVVTITGKPNRDGYFNTFVFSSHELDSRPARARNKAPEVLVLPRKAPARKKAA